MSEIKVNKLSPRTACGTVTLGDSGDTFTIPAGATITNNGTAAGFGATGAVSWDTTVKTTGFTAVSGVGYFVNTTAGAITVTLPLSPAAGAVIGVSDYANIFATNNLTLGRNGSNIGGVAADSVLVVNGAAVTLVYVDATKGWIVTDSGLQSDASELKLYITATGGTITTSGDYKIHTFTGPGTFCVSCAGNPGGSTTVDYLVVAGGGGGGQYYGGGGGAGGARMSAGTSSGSYTVGPLGACVSALSVPVAPYPITVGGGGAGGPSGTPTPGGTGFDGFPGSNSIFSSITSTGGGGAAGSQGPARDGKPGGSGGGATGGPPGAAACGGTGNTPPVSPPQGQPGGNSPPGDSNGGGGGGATDPGDNGSPSNTCQGGVGVANNITPTVGQPSGGNFYFAGGGNPSNSSYPDQPEGGLGGGGTGPGSPDNGVGDANTGGGGGGNVPLGTGGSGVVVIRYKFQN
jgi:hypothetical protein